MFTLPTLKIAKDTAAQGGSVAAGFLLAHLTKTALFDFKKEDGTSLLPIPDNSIVNLSASLASLGTAMVIKNPYAQLGLLGFATFFAIRALNKVTSSLTGLGNDGQPSMIKEYMQKYLPNLAGLGEITMAMPINLPTQSYLPESSTMNNSPVRKAIPGGSWAG